MYAEDENSLPRKDNTDTNVALDTQHDAGESPLRRSKRISHLPNQPKYKLSDYYRNMSCDELSKCSDDYAHGSEEEAFGGLSDPESINTYTYISSGDDNDETHGSTVKKEPTVHVKMESNTSQGDLDESATRGDRVEQELVVKPVRWTATLTPPIKMSSKVRVTRKKAVRDTPTAKVKKTTTTKYMKTEAVAIETKMRSKR